MSRRPLWENGPIEAFSRLMRTNQPAPYSRRETAEIARKVFLLDRLAMLGTAPRLLSPPLLSQEPKKIGDRYDWTTGAPDDGNEWRKRRVVPRAHPSRPAFYAYFHRSRSKGAFRLPRGWRGITSAVRCNFRLVIFGAEKRLVMAMFRRTFAQTSRSSEREPHMKVWGFETKGQECSPELRHEHCHGISLPYFLRPRGGFPWRGWIL